MSAAWGPWVAAAAAAATFLLGHFSTSGAAGTGEPWGFHIVNFNFETVQVTWDASLQAATNVTFLYRFDGMEDTPCSNYTLWHGRRVGCVFPAGGDQVMNFSVWNGPDCLDHRAVWIGDYLKPRSPRDLHFQWHQEAVTVTCADLPYRSLLYEVQFKGVFDAEWQSREQETCNVTIEALDTDRCYSFRARVKTMASSYGNSAYPSDWSQVTHWQQRELKGSCGKKSSFSKLVFLSCLAALLIMLLLPLSVWRLQRVKKLLVPSVPDPKGSFPGLFESHHGNFQEWIKDTQNVTRFSKGEDVDAECVVEEAVVVPMPKAGPETPAGAVPCLHPGLTATEGHRCPSCQPPAGEERVSLRGFTFGISDNAYVTL